MQAVYIINVTRFPLIITIEIEANLYKLAHTTSMLTANWRAIIFANLRFTICADVHVSGCQHPLTAQSIISYNICHAMGNLRYSVVKLFPNHVFAHIHRFKWLLDEIIN
ncbi:hypothetical protein ALC62_13918 [Cyphomyrmex costatus]|uniref:Uncharacterized protein n=1 Tax=Cyphomyrmex costatus TaxID=456900 RepID=A0A195C3P9_9HYME|nr:hypothetical protein ALC62_13918 [Cyphomyrmex costatus]